MFSQHLVTAAAFAQRFVELLPEYLPGVDTGAFEATDRRRCWNKSLKSVLTVMGEQDHHLEVSLQVPALTLLKDQSSVLWQRDGAAVFAMTTGWGDRHELESSLQSLESYKCPQKLFVYSCTRWQDAVLDQIRGALLHYPYHMAGEQYLFMNLVGPENRMHLFSADLTQNGKQTFRPDMLQPVPGSPFAWVTKHFASH